MKKQLKMLLLSVGIVVVFAGQSLAAGVLDLPRTGQTKCYDATGKDIVCTGTGQDGELRAGVAIPVPRFKDNGDGTVTDKVTGLIWLKNANCFGYKLWLDALNTASTLANGACGLADGSKSGDWRLPNRNELMSIIDNSKVAPALQLGHPFVNVLNDTYWTSSTFTGNTATAWYLTLSNGFSNYYSKTNGYYYTWPVRAGQ